MKFLADLLAAGILAVVGVSFVMTRPLHVYQDTAQNSGVIAGFVLDAGGKPVSGAEVYTYRPTSPMGKLPRAVTNKQGKFLIKDLRPGTYVVAAAKEEDSYPPTDNYSFYYASFLEAPQVIVYERQTTSGVMIHFGPRAARLVGHIVDATTNEPISPIPQGTQITLRRADNPDNSYSTGPNTRGNFNILVPPVPFTIKVSAPGY
ncbi:MAG: Carboxypeptidase regulatory-like domain [Acidobacteriota bacterium]|jgi:hypothetical protein|nr:Carboxypeptidase regulatory-like domain [Acidobacteriota bacterium]